MTQLPTTPTPPPLGQHAGYADPTDGFTGPAPWSALAISAFVCSLLGFLGVTAILGIILGVVGIFVTSGGKRRGMGLAIAALPISIITGLVSIALVVGILFLGKLVAMTTAVLPVFEANAAERPQAMVEFRKFTSQAFDETVTDEQFFKWVDQIEKDHGKLAKITANYGQGGSQPTQNTTTDGRVAWSIPAKFVNGPATIQMIFKQEGMWETKLDDISVGGVSPRGSPQ